MTDLKRVVITGTTKTEKHILKRELALQGYLSASNVTKDTVCVIAGEKPRRSTLNVAKRAGCPVLAEADVLVKRAGTEPTVALPTFDQCETPSPLGRQPWMDALATNKSVMF